MFKKLISMATATLLFATGLAVVSAVPANAAPTYTSNPGSVESKVTFSYGITTTGTAATFTLPSGITSLDLYASFTVGTTSTTSARTKALRATFELRDPSNNLMTLASQGSTLLYFYEGNTPIMFGNGSGNLSPSQSATVPGNITEINVSNSAKNWIPTSGSTFASGTYSLTPLISFDNTVLPLGTDTAALILEEYSSVLSYGTSTSFTNPSVTLENVQQEIGTCLDTSLVSAGDVLTATTSLNGSDSTLGPRKFFNLSTNGPLNNGVTRTLTAGDLTSGVVAVANQLIPTTSDLAVTSDISLTVGGVEVSKKCLGVPSTPSLAVLGTTMTGTVINSTSTDAYTCNFYDSTNPNVIAITKTIRVEQPKRCTADGIAERTYTLTIIVNRRIGSDTFSITSDASLASGPVTIPVPSVVLTPPSGNTTSGIAAAAEAAREAAAARVVAIAIAKIELQGVLKDGKSGTLGQYQAADFFPVNEKTVARVNESLLKLAVADRQNAEKIMAIVKAENFVEQVSTTATQKSVTSGQLVDLKLIPATSPNKASVTSAIKKAPVASLTSLAKIQAVIDAHLASLKARQDRTAAIKAKIAAGNK